MAGSFSKVNDPLDNQSADYIRQRLYRIKEQEEALAREKASLLHIQKLMQFCPRCGGGGTINEHRTEDDSPWYEPCPDCGGKGHLRDKRVSA